MVGYNYEESRMKNVKVLRNGLIFDDAEDLNMPWDKRLIPRVVIPNGVYPEVSSV